MKKGIKSVYIYLFEGYADWEISFLSPAKVNASDSSKCQFITMSKGAQAVKSLNGLNVKPDVALESVDINDIDMLLLPGGDAWFAGANSEIVPLADAMVAAGKTVATICGATIFAAQRGYLNEVKHTSNAPILLKQFAPEYLGEALYTNDFAVTDKNIITANGIAPVDFAREIFRGLEIFAESDIEKWYQLFKNGIWMY